MPKKSEEVPLHERGWFVEAVSMLPVYGTAITTFVSAGLALLLWNDHSAVDYDALVGLGISMASGIGITQGGYKKLCDKYGYQLMV